MSIFAYKPVTENAVQPSTGFVNTSLSGLQEILTESARDMFQLNASLYISDVLMEHAVLEGAATPEVLLEGFVSSTWEKLKQIFTAMWEKVQGWFTKVKRQFEIWFSRGQEFVKKFKDELRDKNVKGFKYTGYHYTISKGEETVDKHIATLKSELASSVDFDLSKVLRSDQEDSIRNNAAGDYDTKEAKENLLNKLGASEQSELLAEVAKEFRNGADEPTEFEDFSGNSRDEMIAWLEKGSEHLNNVKKQQKDLNDSFGRVLNSIKAAKSKIAGSKTTDAEVGKFTAFASHKYDVAQYALSLMTNINGVHVKAIKAATNEFERVLKSFLSFKPAKEGFEETQQTKETNSILEAALRHL